MADTCSACGFPLDAHKIDRWDESLCCPSGFVRIANEPLDLLVDDEEVEAPHA